MIAPASPDPALAPLSLGECRGLISRLAAVAGAGPTGPASGRGDGTVGTAGGGSGNAEAEDVAGVDARMLAMIGALEAVKAAACAAQARLAVAVDRVRREQEARLGVPAAQRGRGVGAEIALARRESPHRGSRLLGLAKAPVQEMPATMGLLTAGELNEWRATLMVRETATLDQADRIAVDGELAPHLAGLSDREIADRARVAAYRLDPTSPLKRGRHATTERYVALRPAPDTMAILTAYLPVVDGVSCFAALRRHADTLQAAGDTRSRAQLMADTLTERLTGRTPTVGPDIEIGLIMTDRALFGPPAHPHLPDDDAPDVDAATPASAHDGGVDEPATILGYGPVPASFARALLRDPQATRHDPASQPGQEAGPCAERDVRAPAYRDDQAGRGVLGPAGENGETRSGRVVEGHAQEQTHGPGAGLGGDAGPDSSPAEAKPKTSRGEEVQQARAWIRRLYTDPATGTLVDVDSKRRLFTPAQRRHLILRDRYCRTPWCGAPIRHADHVTPAGQGGPTSITNGQGLCARCNHTKEAPGWTAHAETPPTRSTETAPATTQASRTPGEITLTTPSGAHYRSLPHPIAPPRPKAGLNSGRPRPGSSRRLPQPRPA